MSGDDKDATIAALRARVKVLEDACGWVVTHEGVSVANAARQQRVIAAALYQGKTPEQTLAVKETER